MENIKLTPEELKNVIDFGKLIGNGFFGSVFTYKGKLIKMDNILYNLLHVNDKNVSKDVIASHYKWGKQDFNNREQLEMLSQKQDKIRPKVPEGIITIKSDDPKIDGISPGIIIPHFIDYQSLGNISKTEYRQLLILLRKVFDDIKSLADNEIAQEDLFTRSKHPDEMSHYNIIQKGNDAQIIDMSGPLVKVGKDYENPNKMYTDFANLINYYNEINGLDKVYQEDDNITEDKLNIMLNEFEKQTNNKK